MAAPLFFRGVPLLRLRFPLHHRLAAVGVLTLRSWCSSSESTRPDDVVPCTDQNTAVLIVKDPPKILCWNDPEFREWKDKEQEIIRDIEPVALLTKAILHSDRYKDGERLANNDEKAIVEKLLAYHPHSEDKVGCGLDYIMVDRHPQYRQSRCLFVVRTDGGWIDFSYQKCLRAYVRQKYPSHAERFIKKHFKRGSHL